VNADKKAGFLSAFPHISVKRVTVIGQEYGENGRYFCKQQRTTYTPFDNNLDN